MSKFFELIKFLGQHWPGFCGEKNESHFPNFLKDANPLKSDEGPWELDSNRDNLEKREKLNFRDWG